MGRASKADAMVATTLTDQQRAAVRPNGCSIALSAGAGCGKTRVLTERFLLHLAPGPSHVEMHRLAALTFTERAAREMRDRIRRRCHERMQTCPDRELRHWQDVLQDLETARISTIHAFCMALLRAHCVQAALDPQFTVVDESTAGALLHRVVEQTLFDRLASGDADAEELVLRYRVGRVQRWLVALSAECDPRSLDRWLATDAEALAAHWRQQWEEQGLRREVKRLVRSPETQSLLDILRRTSSGNAVMEERRVWLVEHLPALEKSPVLLKQLRDLAQHARVQGAGREGAWPAREIYDRVRNALTGLRRQARHLAHVSGSSEAATAEAAIDGMRLLRLTGHALRAYGAAKSEAALVDFRDLLIKTRKLLSGHPTARAALASALELILVDEFQDTDPIQVEILRLLCGDELARGKLFIVGDAKQAIYRFRRADPQLFAELRDELPEEGRKSITKNFRSQPAVLRFVNRLFCETFGPDYEPLVAQTRQATPAPNVEFLWTKCEPTREAQQRRHRIEAQSIARRIREMLDAGEPRVMDRADDGGRSKPALRRPQQGDVALLFRALSHVRFYEEALRREGLDYYLVGGYGFYAQQEIWDLLNLLRALEDPDDAVSLAGALRSPFFSLRDETLYWLAMGRGDLDGGLRDPARWRPLDDQQRGRVAFAAGVLQQLRSAKDRLPLSGLLQQLFDLTGYDAVLLAEFLGERKLANLRKIRNLARQFDAAGLFTLADFIAHVQDSVARQPREEQAATHPEQSDVVRLMTIHQAKGLEFPIVFVPDLERKDQYGPRGPVLHPEAGPLVRLPEGEDHLGLELYKALEREQEEREEQRLFYVACTRAADYLVLSSSVRDLGKPQSQWMRLLAERFDLVGGSAFGASADDPDARVRIEQADDDGRAGHGRGGGQAVRLPNWSEVVAKVRRAGPCVGTLPKAAEAIRPALERRRQFGPTELAAAARRRRLREELPLFRRVHEDGLDAACEVFVAESDPGDGDLPPAGTAAWGSAAALVGSTVHAVLRCIDFEAARAGMELDALETLVAQCAIEFDSLGTKVDIGEATGLVQQFLGSSVAAALAEAPICHRELEILLCWPPSEGPGHGSENDGPARRYLRGFLDCVYQDPQGGWHLVDYKTDAVEAETVAARAEQYRLQLAVYALATRHMVGDRLQSVELYFLRPGVAWSLELKADWEQWMVREVDAAIEELVAPRGGL